MPWKRKKPGFRVRRSLFIALAAAVFGGVLACLLGTQLQQRSSALTAKYSSYMAIRSLLGSRSPAEIKAAMERRGIKAP
ncbi:MAG: hypothetical protein PHV36_11000 [Elusimicrobiales bacterium]|nr:hypothetical protein [Elusimicrobiales bacterium]